MTRYRSLYKACLEGRAPAETLPTAQRSLLVRVLHSRGFTDLEIAEHTRMSLYTTARIRQRCELLPNIERKEVA